MLQRSPTYIASVPEEYPMSVWLRRFLSDPRIVRWFNWTMAILLVAYSLIARLALDRGLATVDASLVKLMGPS